MLRRQAVLSGADSIPAHSDYQWRKSEANLRFALATDDNTLMVFGSEKEAIGYCEGLDVFNGNWLFFSQNGTPLKAIFSTAPKGKWLIDHGKYSLIPDDGPGLRELFPRIAAVEGPPDVKSLADVERVLADAERGPQRD
jgi:hypothetical protein